MRILAGIVVALFCAAGAIAYAAWGARELPPSPLAELEKPAPVAEAVRKEEPNPAAQEPSAIEDKSRSHQANESAPQMAAETPPAADKGLEEKSSSEPVLEAMRSDVRNVTPDHVLPGPDIAERMIERLPAVVPPAPPPRPPEPERWRRALVVAPGVLRSGDKRIVIAGIEPLDAEATCRADDGADWPCGKFATAALRRLVRQRPVECDPVGEGTGQKSETGNALEERLSAALGKENGAGDPDRIVTRCNIAGRDIGEWMVEQGWAKPAAGSGYDAAEKTARDGERGQWRERAVAELPENEPAGVDLTQIVPQGGSLLAPGMSASDALVPLPEPASPGFVPLQPETQTQAAEPGTRGGLDR